MDYSGKIVVVTGAAHGLGRAISIEYALAGAHVILADIQNQPQLATIELLRQAGMEAHAYQCDVGSEESVLSFAETVQRDVGTPDIIHNNAVMIRSGGIVDLDLQTLQAQVNVNVYGYIRVVKAFLGAMLARGSGWIVNTASPNGIIPPQLVSSHLFSYCLCKAANISMSQCMADSLRGHGIGVSVVFPDITYTETVEELSGTSSNDFHKGFSSFLKAEGKPADVVGKRIVDGIRQRSFFVNVAPGFEDALVLWAQNRMNPDIDYISEAIRSKADRL